MMAQDGDNFLQEGWGVACVPMPEGGIQSLTHVKERRPAGIAVLSHARRATMAPGEEFYSICR